MTEQSSKTALLSVYDKQGIVEFGYKLTMLGWNLLASGGTAKALRDGEVPVRDVAELVGGGAILGHRVVTLSREIHAGLLAQDTPEDRSELMGLGIPWIGLVCVDLYPLKEAINSWGATPEHVINMTDVGGPTMLRSAAKGRRIVVARAADREPVIEWLRAGEPDREQFITTLVARAELIAGVYALQSAAYHGGWDLSSQLDDLSRLLVRS